MTPNKPLITGFDISAPIYTRLNGIECEIGMLMVPADGDPTATLNREQLDAALRASGIRDH